MTLRQRLALLAFAIAVALLASASGAGTANAHDVSTPAISVADAPTCASASADAAGQAVHHAGLVIVFDEQRTETRCVEFTEEEITGAELLRRSGLAVVSSGFGGLERPSVASKTSGAATRATASASVGALTAPTGHTSRSAALSGAYPTSGRRSAGCRTATWTPGFGATAARRPVRCPSARCARCCRRAQRSCPRQQRRRNCPARARLRRQPRRGGRRYGARRQQPHPRLQKPRRDRPRRAWCATIARRMVAGRSTRRMRMAAPAHRQGSLRSVR